MNKFFAQLRPGERRLAVGVLVVLILALNWIFIWPYFSEWGNLRRRMSDAQRKRELYQTAIAETKKYDDLVKGYEGKGQFVAPEDMAINFMRTVQGQAAASGVGISRSSTSITRTNQFFSEQSQSISVVATDAQLVDFLYKLGEGVSLVRVRDLTLQPDAAHQHLNADIQLVATYQNKSQEPLPAPAAKTASKPATPPNLKTATARSK